MFVSRRTSEVCITVDPYREMSAMCGSELPHIRAVLIEVKLCDPVFIQRIFIPHMGTHLKIAGFALRIPVLQVILWNLCILYKDIVIESVITVKYGHESKHFGTVRYMVGSISGLTLSVYYGIHSASHHTE